MRRIGNLESEKQARQFVDYLYTLTIDATTDPGDEPGCWDIWIRDEADVDRSRSALAEFNVDPDQPRFQVGSEAAQLRDKKISEEHKRLQQQRKLQQKNPAETWRNSAGNSLPGARQEQIPVTIAIMLVCVVASFTSNFGNPLGSRTPGELTTAERVYKEFSFVDRDEFFAEGKNDSFASIRKGEIWRLFTPLFLHGNPMHLVFNMIMLFKLGSIIERMHGSIFLLFVILFTGLGGTMLQVLLPTADWWPETLRGTPFAIGASGAVFGLFGFLWIRPLVDSSYPLQMDPMNVSLMLGWLILCMTPLMKGIANGAHLGGLVAGILLAVIGMLFRR